MISIETRNTAVKQEAAQGQVTGRIDVRSDDGERSIGYIDGDFVFHKYNWRSSKHLCRNYAAIGIDKGAFEHSIAPFATVIEIHDKDTEITYSMSVDGFQEHCFEDDLGWGPQLFCPLKHFHKADSSPNAPRQLSLWD